MKHRWILNGTGLWHAWPARGRSTYCGRINVEHLRMKPAAAIALEPPAGASTCSWCVKKSGYVAPSQEGDAVTAAWIGVIGRHLTRSCVRAAADSVRDLAVRLSLIGTPESPEAQDTYDQVKTLLLRPCWTKKKYVTGWERSTASLPYLKEALAALPPGPDALRTVASVLKTWRDVTRRDPVVEKFNAVRVVTSMLQVPEPAAYVAHMLTRGLPTLAAMFHPNTLERARRDTAMRGMFAGSGDYWRSTTDQLHIIED